MFQLGFVVLSWLGLFLLFLPFLLCFLSLLLLLLSRIRVLLIFFCFLLQNRCDGLLFFDFGLGLRLRALLLVLLEDDLEFALQLDQFIDIGHILLNRSQHRSEAFSQLLVGENSTSVVSQS